MVWNSWQLNGFSFRILDRIVGYGVVDPMFESRLKKETSVYTKMSTPDLGPTQSPIQWVPGFFAGSEVAGVWC